MVLTFYFTEAIQKSCACKFGFGIYFYEVIAGEIFAYDLFLDFLMLEHLVLKYLEVY